MILVLAQLELTVVVLAIAHRKAWLRHYLPPTMFAAGAARVLQDVRCCYDYYALLASPPHNFLNFQCLRLSDDDDRHQRGRDAPKPLRVLVLYRSYQTRCEASLLRPSILLPLLYCIFLLLADTASSERRSLHKPINPNYPIPVSKDTIAFFRYGRNFCGTVFQFQIGCHLLHMSGDQRHETERSDGEIGREDAVKLARFHLSSPYVHSEPCCYVSQWPMLLLLRVLLLCPT